jgi:orotate phosphoribosyltransferase
MTGPATTTRGDARLARLKAIVTDKALRQDGSFRLASGATSSFYLDMRVVSLDPEGSNLIGELMLDALAGETVDAVGGLETGAIAVVAAIVQASHRSGRPIPGFYVRKKAKEHGMGNRIEGNLPAGGTVVVVEDVTTSGQSPVQAVEAVRAAGCRVARVLTVVDREAGAAETLAQHDLRLASLLRRADFGV